MEFLSLSRRRSSARNVPSGEERGETDVFAGYWDAGGSNLRDASASSPSTMNYELVYFKGLNKSTQRPRILKTDNIQSGGSCSEGHPAPFFVK